MLHLRPRAAARIGAAALLALTLLLAVAPGPAAAAPARPSPAPPRPTLTFSSYLGGTGDERAFDLGRDAAGNLYIYGTVRWGSLLNDGFRYSADAFVLKLTAGERRVGYVTYLGGGDDEFGGSMAVAADGSVYVTGLTTSYDMPLVRPLQAAHRGVGSDAFVAGLSPDGAVRFSTYLGGSQLEHGTAVALAPDGDLVLTGITESDDFPLVAARDSTRAHLDGFVARLAPDGQALRFSSYFGGGSWDYAQDVAVGGDGDIYLVGGTESADFPLVDALDGSLAFIDAFVARLSPDGRTIRYSTYLGGWQLEEAARVSVDAAGSAYVAGTTNSADFPTVSAAQGSGGGDVFDRDAFVSKLSPDGRSLAYSTYLGGRGAMEGLAALVVDAEGRATVAGYSDSEDFPLRDPLQATVFSKSCVPWCDEGFVTQLAATGDSFVFSTYYGGSGMDHIAGLALGAGGAVQLAGSTGSLDLPLVRPLRYAVRGYDDLLIAEIAPQPLAAAGRASGKGRVPSGADPERRAYFGFYALQSAPGGPVTGNLSFDDEAAHLRLRSSELISATRSGNTYSVSGRGKLNGAPVGFTLVIQDNGAPGSGRDTLKLRIDGGSAANATITGGEIKLAER